MRRRIRGRRGVLARESVVDKSPLLVAAEVREIEQRGGELNTLLSLATAVRPEWLSQLYPQHLTERITCDVDRLHKRVASYRETRFLDLDISRPSVVVAQAQTTLPAPAARLPWRRWCRC